MHQPTTLEPDTLDNYEWPLCTAGPATGPHAHRLWDNELDRLVCWPCEEKTAARLAELPTLFRQLNTTAMLMKGASRSGGATSGTRTAPIPPRLDVLNLTGPGGIATRLRDIEDAWRKTFGRRIAPWAGSPTQAVPIHAGFLAINLRRACESYESIGQDIEDLRRLHAQCTALISNEPRTGRVPVGICPARLDTGPCGTPLTASTGSHHVRCETCGTRWDGMGEWRNLRAAQETAALERAQETGVAA